MAIVRQLVLLNRDQGRPDDIDHLGNRRIRAVGELIQNQFRIGLLRMERVIKERMTIQDPESATPAALVNIRPVVAAMKEFFGGSQLSQFMDQTNPLAELTHKRRLSALGPGGLSRERAGFDVRDVHESHYGRICPVETPEGPNIGLIGSLATYGRINDYGFIETPYRKVHRTVQVTAADRPRGAGRADAHRAPAEGPPGPRGEPPHHGPGQGGAGSPHRGRDGRRPGQAGRRRARASSWPCAPSSRTRSTTSPRMKKRATSWPRPTPAWTSSRTSLETRVAARFQGEFQAAPAERVDLMDVSPKQIVSVAAALIPFLEHDDANRALMGANMQRQAVPLLRPQAPLVATGVEAQAARELGPGGARPRPRRGGQGRRRRGGRPGGRDGGAPALPAALVRAHQPGHLPLAAPPGAGRGAGAPPGRPWRTACPPPGGSWPWGRTCWGPSCSGRGATSRTPS